MKNETSVGCRINVDLKELLSKIAKNNKRSLSKEMVIALEKHVEEAKKEEVLNNAA